MPELPEVETIRRGMEKAMKGKTVKSVNIRRRDLRTPIQNNFETLITGKTLNNLERRGKYMILNFSDDINAVLHMGMSGRIHISNTDKAPLKHDHVILYMHDDTRISFEDPRRFGMFYICAKDWETEKPFATMGPEPLGNTISGATLYEKLKTRKAPIKQALLDQNVIAGLGNIYVCEALFQSRLHPKMHAHKITEDKSDTLMRHIREILNEAIESGGSSLKDYQHTDGTLGYFQHGFQVYDREGKTCQTPSCNDYIVRIIQSGRSTFFCPRCQSDTL